MFRRVRCGCQRTRSAIGSCRTQPGRSGESATTMISNREYPVFARLRRQDASGVAASGSADRNDDRDQRRSGDLVADPERARCRAGQHLGAFARAPEMIGQCAAGGFVRPRLGVERARRRFRQLAPPIQDLRDVVDAGRPLHHPQHQVVILCPFVAEAEAADLFDQTSPHRHQMARVHAREEMLRRPVGLEVRIAAPPFEVELVFVRVRTCPRRGVGSACRTTSNSASGVSSSS